MSNEHLNELIHKVEEIKALFTIGQRIVPFIEELFKFVQETAPIINDMNESIKESTKKMPKATQQLDKVTEETELATTEMLDRIDKIIARITESTNKINSFKESIIKKEELFETIKSEFKKYKFNENEKLLEKTIKVTNEFLDKKHETEFIEMVENTLDDIQNNVFDIMNALQFQDITSQQINAANSLLSSIQNRLNSLISKFANIKTEDITIKHVAFDEDATMQDADKRQKSADEIFKK